MGKMNSNLESLGESVDQGYLERYRLAMERIETLEKEQLEQTAKSITIAHFIRSIRGTSALLTQFDETLWLGIIDSVTVTRDDKMIFRFKNSSEITI
jgi:hypothetical protein